MAHHPSPITQAAAAFLEAGRTADRERAARHRHPTVAKTVPADAAEWARHVPFPTI